MKLKAVSEIMLTLLLISMLTLAFNIQWAIGDASDEDTVEVQAGTRTESVLVNKSLNVLGSDLDPASVPTNYTRIHGHVYKNHTLNHPLRGILLELWDNSSNTLVVGTTSSDSDVDPGAFDFGDVYTGPNRAFFIRIVAKGYNSTGYNMLDVVNETTGSLVYYDSPAFTCYSEQDYSFDLYGPDEGDPTTIADQAINIYYYIWLVYNYFRKHLNHFISHVTAHIVSGYAGASANANNVYFGAGVSLFYRHAFGHEYGHSIMLQIYWPGTYCNSTQGHSHGHEDRTAWNMSHHVLADPDFGTATYPVPCSGGALLEGWANFVPWIAYGDYNYTYGPPWFGWWLDMREGAGEKNEYGFAGILHDICNIPGQDRNTMMRYIWEVISKDHPGAVNMFYSAFVARYPELADDVKIAYMKRFAVFSRLGIAVNATENASGLHVNISGYLMPFPHPNKTVTVNYRLVGDASWTWLANVTTDNSSFYSVTADLPEGVYEFQASWSGDREHHTGHYGSASDIVRTDEHYIGSVNGVKFYTDKSIYYPGDTVQIKILNTNYTQKTISAYLLFGRNRLWPTFYNFSYTDFYLQIFYPNGTLALNKSVSVSPFYGITHVNFTNTMMMGSYIVKVFNNVVGSVYVSGIYFITTTVDIDPDTLNLKSKGKWITCYIELPEGYNVSDINISTVMLNDTIPVSLLDVPALEPVPTEIGDYDDDGIPDLMVKFDRTAVSDYILNQNITYGNVTLTVTGELRDGTPFESSDMITSFPFLLA